MTLYRATVIDTPGDPFAGDPADALAAESDGGLLVRDGVIVARGAFAALRAEHPDEPVTELTGGLLLPGFVDTHVHYPQLRAIGGLGMPLLDWLEKCALPEESRLADPELRRPTSRRSSSANSSRCGTTTALVFGSHFEPAMDILFTAAQDAGLNITTGLVLSDRILRPDLLCSPAAGAGRLAAPDRPLARQGPAAVRGHPAVLAVHHRTRCWTSAPNCSTRTAAERRLVHLARQREPGRGRDRRRPVPGHRALHRHLPPARPGHRPQRVRAQRAPHRPRTGPDGRGRAPGRRTAPPATRRWAAGCSRCAGTSSTASGVALGSDVGAGTGLFLPKEGLQAYFMQQLLGAQGLPLTPVHLLYLATRAGARALGLADRVGDLGVGQGLRRRLAATGPTHQPRPSTCGTPPTRPTRWPGSSRCPPPPTSPACGCAGSRPSDRAHHGDPCPDRTAHPGRPPQHQSAARTSALGFRPNGTGSTAGLAFHQEIFVFRLTELRSTGGGSASTMSLSTHVLDAGLGRPAAGRARPVDPRHRPRGDPACSPRSPIPTAATGTRPTGRMSNSRPGSTS